MSNSESFPGSHFYDQLDEKIARKRLTIRIMESHFSQVDVLRSPPKFSPKVETVR